MQHMTNEERLALATKLDKELDEFIAGLEKRPYTEGWAEDRWQEEMEKHPFFMKKPPEAGEEVNPLMEGLQQLKYDPNENTPEELANAYKEDGNFNFKHGNYRLAIIAYTEGLKVKCNNTNIDSLLYNNRAAANYFLKNYLSSLRDCEWALRLKPNYYKAIIRAAKCCLEVKLFSKGIEYCDALLSENCNSEILQLRQTILNEKKKADNNLRKLCKLKEKKNALDEKLMKAIAELGVKLEGDLRPLVPELSNCMVHLNGTKLVWPVIFTYPEYRIMDFIQKFVEDDLLREHLNCVFEECPSWDIEKKYNVANLHVYFENHFSGKLYLINIDTKLRDVLKRNEFIVEAGTPSFLIFVRDSPAEVSFLELYKNKIK